MTIGRNFAIFLLTSVVGVLECLGNRVVTSSAGTFVGEVASEGEYFEFLGIPYGQVNARNPFGVASPQPVISGAYVANNDSVVCPQQLNGVIRGSLDCLRLNVFIPTTANNVSQLPVMVYIHGGFFQLGAGIREYVGPRFLPRHDVIVVTFNYRVGPYGFMCLNRRKVPGNQGLKDQILALKWVRVNIGAFGGNPDEVTIFGQSAGAHSVDFHLLSQHEKLYSKVIIQSGSSLAQTVNYEPDRNAPIRLASYLGLPHGNISEALASLTDAPTNDVIRAAVALNIQFKPCAETQFENVEAFITHPWVHSPVPKAQNLSILIGFTEYENLVTHINTSPEHFQNIANIVNDSLTHTFDFDADKMTRMEDYMRRFYLGDSDVSEEVVWQIINFRSDHLYNHPIHRSINKYVAAGAANIYYYMFTYTGGRSAVSVNNLNGQGAGHTDDLRYIFDVLSPPPEVSAEDQVIVDRMTTMWTNFAKFSDPIPETTELLPIRWTPITGNIYHYLDIGSNLTMARRPFNRRFAFWDLFFRINGDDQKSYEAAIAAEDDDEDDDDSGSITITGSLFNILLAFILVTLLRK